MDCFGLRPRNNNDFRLLIQPRRKRLRQ
jgi:hypothetical protein